MLPLQWCVLYSTLRALLLPLPLPQLPDLAFSTLYPGDLLAALADGADLDLQELH